MKNKRIGKIFIIIVCITGIVAVTILKVQNKNQDEMKVEATAAPIVSTGSSKKENITNLTTSNPYLEEKQLEKKDDSLYREDASDGETAKYNINDVVYFSN